MPFLVLLIVIGLSFDVSAQDLRADLPESAYYPFIFTGSGKPGSSVTVSIDGEVVAFKKIDADGNFRIELIEGPIGELTISIVSRADSLSFMVEITEASGSKQSVKGADVSDPPEPVENQTVRETNRSTADKQLPIVGRILVVSSLALMLGAVVIPGTGAFTEYNWKGPIMQIGMSVSIPLTVHFLGKAFNQGRGRWWATILPGYAAMFSMLAAGRVFSDDPADWVLFTPLVTTAVSMAAYEIGAMGDRTAFSVSFAPSGASIAIRTSF